LDGISHLFKLAFSRELPAQITDLWSIGMATLMLENLLNLLFLYFTLLAALQEALLNSGPPLKGPAGGGFGF
jgi:hypothetical protein